jgi:hypothetical protein
MAGLPTDVLGDPIGTVTSGTFKLLSRMRGRRIFHPHGVGFEGRLIPRAEGGPFGGETRTVLVRLSRSVGVPERLRDPCGLGIRILDLYGDGAHQDLLMVSSSRLPGARHLLLPARDFATSNYSTLLPYRLDGRLVLFGACLLGIEGDTITLSDLRERELAGIAFSLMIASAAGRWHEVATLDLHDRMPDREVEELRLDPSNTGGRLELAGVLNRLRRPAYRGSQDGRSSTTSTPSPTRAAQRSTGSPAPTRPPDDPRRPA